MVEGSQDLIRLGSV